MRNVFKEFTDIFPPAPLQVGTVTAVSGSACTVQLPGGGVLQVRGDASVGQRVFLRDGVIEGQAPDLPVVVIEI